MTVDESRDHRITSEGVSRPYGSIDGATSSYEESDSGEDSGSCESLTVTTAVIARATASAMRIAEVMISAMRITGVTVSVIRIAEVYGFSDEDSDGFSRLFAEVTVRATVFNSEDRDPSGGETARTY